MADSSTKIGKTQNESRAHLLAPKRKCSKKKKKIKRMGSRERNTEAKMKEFLMARTGTMKQSII